MECIGGFCYNVVFCLHPAYHKDDFFDAISCNSIGYGDRNGQNRFSDGVRLDSEVMPIPCK